MMLSTHFSLAELIASNTATRLGINNVPGANEIANLQRLCVEVLEPVRAAVGQPVRVTSGLRVPALNRAVGGSATSDHCDGRAADIVVDVMPARELAHVIRALALPYRQLICEFGAWVHVSIPPAGQPAAREVLTATRIAGRTQYLQGIA